MNWREVDLRFRPHGLFVMGTLIDESSTIALIGAAPTMWQVFTRSMAYQDRQPDPLDRWSKQIITPIAQELGAKAHFPSDGPPYPPFIQWALASHRFWQSPVGMLVHDMAGLMISLRGALEVHTENQSAGIETPAPCETCIGQPCRTACPVDALSAENGYDVAACHAFLNTGDGADCMQNGCKARRACPISQKFGRDPVQSAFHMRSFHPK